MQATFAAGCFWGVEASFREIKGVKDTEAGYTGGKTKNPTYREVCTDRTGHAEAVRVTYDPKQVTFKDLLAAFFAMHDAKQLNRQGPDTGSQYRSAIFYHSESQRKEAEEAKKKQPGAVTEISRAKDFYRAEEYHQRYAEKHGGAACHI